MEICIDCLESARNAIEGNATRLEVCSSLSEGGLTPTPGLIKQIRRFSPIPIFAMLRIRAGDFVYSKEELDAMLHDLKILKDHDVNGFVFGALTPENEVDIIACKEILTAANPFPVTFHRAFDTVNDPLASLEILIDLGFQRILTSGQKDTAMDGIELIEALTRKAAERIIVMPGSGISKDNILQIKKATGAKEFHASARMKKTFIRGNRIKIGNDAEPDYVMITEKKLVEEMVKIV